MRRYRIFWLAALVVIVAAPAFAGEGSKCTASTQECLDMMTAKMQNSGWVGIEMEVNEEADKYQVTKVVPNSPAEAAGLKPGDILFAMYDIELNEQNGEKLKQARMDWAPGQKVVYTVKRDGHEKKIKLTLAPMPADVMAQWIGNHMMEHAQLADSNS